MAIANPKMMAGIAEMMTKLSKDDYTTSDHSQDTMQYTRPPTPRAETVRFKRPEPDLVRSEGFGAW